MFRLSFLAFAFFCSSLSSFANGSFTNRKDVQLFINNTAKQVHFNRNELYSIMNQVVIQPKIIESMNKPFEKKNWDVYKALFLTPQRLEEGLKFWRAHQTLLAKTQKRFHVPAEIIIAILGVETLYGARQGEYRVLDALATLAFNYPQRAPYFTSELREYLLLCHEQKIKANATLGSYAGAIGMSQFMPSSYRRYAIDFNHKGRSDLVHNTGDAIASVANYLHKHGWKANKAIAAEVKLTGHRYQSLQANPKFANYSYKKLIKAGIKPVKALSAHPEKAGLIELNMERGREYWIAFPNFFVITSYNSSPQYALAVYLLSEQLKKGWANNFQKFKA